MEQEQAKLLFIVLLWGLLLYELYIYRKGRLSKMWRQHPAKVMDIGVKTRNDEGAEESRPFIKYEYYFLGSRYFGSRFSYGDMWSRNYGASSSSILGITRGEEVLIYVNPQSPRQSVFENGYKGHILWETGILLFIMVMVINT